MNVEMSTWSEQVKNGESVTYPLVSVIVPVYNADRYLEKCVYSILKQTYENFELLLIDDGSRDHSLSVCYKLAKEDHRIQVFTQQNGGASTARNRGLEAAKGKYIVFADSDDTVSEKYIEHLYLAAVLGGYDIVQCKLKKTSKQMERIPSATFMPSDVQEITKEQALNGRMYKVSVWGKIYSSHIFEDFRFREGIIYEDDASYYQLVDRAERIAVLNEILYYYYLSDNSVMRTPKKEVDTLFVDIYEERIQYFSEKQNQCLLDGSYSCFCLVLMYRISQALLRGSRRDNIDWFVDLFRQSYSKIKRSRYVSGKDKCIYACFKSFPRCMGWIMGFLIIRSR